MRAWRARDSFAAGRGSAPGCTGSPPTPRSTRSSAARAGWPRWARSRRSPGCSPTPTGCSTRSPPGRRARRGRRRPRDDRADVPRRHPAPAAAAARRPHPARHARLVGGGDRRPPRHHRGRRQQRAAARPRDAARAAAPSARQDSRPADLSADERALLQGFIDDPRARRRRGRAGAPARRRPHHDAPVPAVLRGPRRDRAAARSGLRAALDGRLARWCPRAPTASRRPPATCARPATRLPGVQARRPARPRTARSRRSRPSTPTCSRPFGLAETL